MRRKASQQENFLQRSNVVEIKIKTKPQNYYKKLRIFTETVPVTDKKYIEVKRNIAASWNDIICFNL